MLRRLFRRSLSNRTVIAAMIVCSAIVAATAASAATLTLSWMDNAAGTAMFKVERKTGTTGTYTLIGTTGTGIETYADSTVSVGTTYCYRVKASNAFGDSGYSNEACGSVAATFDVTIAKAGTGSGTVVSAPAGINCGSDCVGSYVPSGTVTLTATPVGGSFFSGWSGGGCAGTGPCVMAGNAKVTVTATFSLDNNGQVVPGALTLALTGQIRDRVGMSNGAGAPDGFLDGTFLVTLGGTSARTVTRLELQRTGGGVWDTVGSSSAWILGVATSLDGSLLNTSSDSVNFTLAPGGSAVLFASDTGGGLFASGSAFTLTATFSDGSTASASTTVFP